MAISTHTTHAIDITDVEYLRHGDKPLLARLFKPRGSGPFPLIVELHGGAWCRGDRLNDTVLNEALAKSGIVVVALDFRMPPEAPYPASLADIHYGIRWCKTQATAWGSRPDWVGATGSSSGAHQAMLLGMRPHDPRYAALPHPAGAAAVDGSLRCVILCSPVIDPLGRYHVCQRAAPGLHPARRVCRPRGAYARPVLADGRGHGRGGPGAHPGPWGTDRTASRAVPVTPPRNVASPPGPRRVRQAVPASRWPDRPGNIRG